jgi:plastocyanin
MMGSPIPTHEVPLLIPTRGKARTGAAVTIAVLLGVLAACSSGGSGTPPPSGACLKADAQNHLRISAKNIAFNVPCMEAQGGKAIVIEFTNDEALGHDIAVFSNASKTQELAKSNTITGPNASTTITVPPHAPGQLYFECTLHPNMNGALVVTGSPS